MSARERISCQPDRNSNHEVRVSKAKFYLCPTKSFGIATDVFEAEKKSQGSIIDLGGSMFREEKTALRRICL